ncbi:MAG: CapA family protein [Gammaproteobacteria bacterium]|nr:CapA family protein [Gammaproteobacteria bacterium]
MGRSRRYIAVGVLLLLTAACAHGANRNVMPAPASSPATLRVAAVGDLMLGGTATVELAQFGYDYPFVYVGDLLRSADIAFGNLEGPLTARGSAHSKQFVFRSPPDLVAPALARAGFDVVSLANNHSLDYGADGLRDTIDALQRVNIHTAGAGHDLDAARKPAFIDVAGTRVAVLAYSLTFPEEFWATGTQPGTAFGHEQQVRADVAAAHKRADVVLVSFHWGQEGSNELRPYQRTLGHAAIDAGAAAVIGHHPHLLQGVERYRNGVILYSLGNFVFGSYSSTATRSVIAVLSLSHGRVHELTLYPVDVNNLEVVFQPRFLKDRAADEVVEQLQLLSQPLNAAVENRSGVGVLTLTDAP